MRKRYMSAAFILSISMGLSMLAGCGNTAKNTSGVSVTSQESIEEQVSGSESEQNSESGSTPDKKENGSSQQGANDSAEDDKSKGPGPKGQGGPGPSGQGGPGQEGQGGPGQSSKPDSYQSVQTFSKDADISGQKYNSSGKDENAVLVEKGAKVSLQNVTVKRSSDDSTGGDSSSFYGVGAAILNTEGETYIKNSKISTDAAGGAGIFSYGDKAVTCVSDTDITAKQNTSGGIHVAGGGSLYAWNVTAETSGESSAAIRSDRGGGTIVAEGGSFTSNGTGSPAVYSTADITVKDANLTATNSEAVCIEGKNSLRLYNSSLTGNMPENEQNDCTWNVILYQSMSGDSEEGNSTFDMEGGTLTAKNGGMFYTTNTESTFLLNHVNIKYADQNDFFLKCTGNSNKRGWGETGKNGADCSFTAIDQEMKGDVIWDSISTLDFYMTDGSSLVGSVIDDESNAGSGSGEGYCNLTISKDSSWIVTGNSQLTTLSCEGSVKDAEGKTVTIKGTDGTVYVKGDSSYTVTVSRFNKKADLSGAGKITDYKDYQVSKPDKLK